MLIKFISYNIRKLMKTRTYRPNTDFDVIANELAYRVGKPDLTKKEHLNVLIEILKEEGWSNSAITYFVRNIIIIAEATPISEPKDNKVKIYIQPGEKPPKGRKLKKGPRGGIYFLGTPQEKQTSDNKSNKKKIQAPLDKKTKVATKKNVVPVKSKKKVVPQTVKTPLDMTTKSVQYLDKLTPEFLKQKLKNYSPENIAKVNDLTSSLKKLMSSNDDEKNQNLVNDIMNTHKLWVNKDPNLYMKNKLYVGSLPTTDRKILGISNSPILNTISKKLIKYGANLVPQKDPLKDLKNKFQSSSKPTFTDIHDASKDENVKSIFSDKMFSGIDSKYYSVFGPKDKGGSLLWPPNKHSKEYLRFSIENNNALNLTIEAAKEAVKEKKITQKFSNALIEHKNRMTDILNKVKIPSDEARQAIKDSYGKLTHALYEEDSELASSIMKNFAENALYESEIAGGENVLLPANGSFPSADKIKINLEGNSKVERVSGISVKWGKSGLIYGMPAETKQYQKFHPDPDKRDILDNRVGQTGYELGIKNDWVKNKKKFLELYGNSGLDLFFPKNVGTQLYDAANKMLNHVETLKLQSNYDKIKKPAKDKIMLIKDKIQKVNTQLASDILQDINLDALSQKIGKDNANLFSKGIMEMVNIIAFANILRTSNGLDSIEHNHQSYENGKLEFHTEAGSSDIGQWNLNFRPYGDRAGGLIAGFNSERKEKMNLK